MLGATLDDDWVTGSLTLNDYLATCKIANDQHQSVAKVVDGCLYRLAVSFVSKGRFIAPDSRLHVDLERFCLDALQLN